MGYRETIAYLYGLQHHGIKLGLDNPRRLLALLGDPQEGFNSVHIAGTNGKGSASAMLYSMLRASGLSTGLFTSPHLVDFTERIRVDGEEISPGEVVSLADEARQAAEGDGLSPTFFEVVTAMGFLHFARKGVRWAAVETGMGGRLDATNVLLPRATIITSISLDHAEFLGETLEAVAFEKAGIIKHGVPVVMAGQDEGPRRVIEERAREVGAPLYAYGRDFAAEVSGHGPGHLSIDYASEGLELRGLDIPLSGRYQAENASLAIRAFELIMEGSKAEEIEAAARAGLSSLRWPGRLERVAEAPLVLVDGAHNPAAARALAGALREDYLPGGGGLTLVFGAMSDKDARGMLEPLLPLAEEAIFTATGSERAAPPDRLAMVARGLGFENVGTALPVGEALARAVSRGRTVLVTGSFYTAGAAKEALGAKGFEIGLRE